MFCVEIISKLKKVLHTQLSSWSLFTQLLHFSFMISWNIYSYIFPLNHVDIAASIRSTNFPLLFHLVSSRTLLSNHFTVQTLSKSGQNPPYSLAFPVYPNEVPATHWTEPHVCPVSSTWPVPSHPLASVAQTAYKECNTWLHSPPSLGLESCCVLGRNFREWMCFSQGVLIAGAQGVSVDGGCQISPIDLQIFCTK